MFNSIRKLDCFLIGFIYGCFLRHPDKKGSNNREIKRILCIKLWGFGNLVVIYPLLYKLKAKFPDAHVTFITFDVNRGFLEENKAIDTIVYFKLTKNIFRIASQFLWLISRLRRQNIDLVVNFETYNNFSALFSYLMEASVRVGLHSKHEKEFYTHAVNNDKGKHFSAVFSDLLETLEISSCYEYHRFAEKEKERNCVEAMLEWNGLERFVCIHAGTSENFMGKRFRKESIARLAWLLIDRHDVSVVFTGIQRDRGIIEEIIKLIGRKENVFNWAGSLTIWELGELLRKSCFFVSGDTGPVHFAASLGVNVAAIYGPTSPKRFGPLHDNSLVFHKGLCCGPCVGVDYINKPCVNNYQCMDFSPEEIYARIVATFFHGQWNRSATPAGGRTTFC